MTAPRVAMLFRSSPYKFGCVTRADKTNQGNYIIGWLGQIDFFTVNVAQNLVVVQMAVVQVTLTCFCHNET